MTEMDRNSTLKAFELAHQVLISVPELGENERRKAPRYQFTVRRWIAPYDGSNYPDKSKFFPVRCRDLSRSGFSFVMSKEPEFSDLVVSLRKPPNRVRVSAEVAWCRKIRLLGGVHVKMTGDAGDDASNDQGDDAFLVGCRFKRRLN